MLSRIRRRAGAVSEYFWVIILGGGLIVLIFISFSGEGTGVETSAFQPTLDAVATQTNQYAPTVAAQLTLTPPAVRLTGAAPTLVLIGRQEAVQFAAGVPTTDNEQDDVYGGAVQAVGPPNTDGCNDAFTAWQPTPPADQLTLLFAQPVIPTRVRVHQTFNTGFVARITFVDLYGEQFVVYNATPQALPCPYILDAAIEDIETPGGRLIISISNPNRGAGTQIDAVELIGIKY